MKHKKNVIHEWGYTYNIKNISIAVSHILLKLYLIKAKIYAFRSMVKYASYHNLRIHEY